MTRQEPFKTRLRNVRIKRDWVPHFTDHAMLRYIERVHHIDVEALKKTLATDALRAAVVFGHGSVKKTTNARGSSSAARL